MIPKSTSYAVVVDGKIVFMGNKKEARNYRKENGGETYYSVFNKKVGDNINGN